MGLRPYRRCRASVLQCRVVVWPGWVAALVLALCFPPESASAQVPVADSTEVRSLRFRGNSTIRDSALRAAILTADTHCRSPLLAPVCWLGGDWAVEHNTLNPLELARDMARIRLFYFRRGFREAQVDTVVDREAGAVDVTFRIREGQPARVSEVAIEGDGPGFSDDEVASLPLQVGAHLSLLALEATRDRILARLGNEGYAHAEVLAGFTLPAATPYAAEVVFQVLPGPLARYGTVTVQGNADLADGAVHRLMPIREGDVYSDDQLALAQRNLFDLAIVRHAEILPDLKHDPDSVVPLDVRINEAGAHRIRAGGGFSTSRCINVESSWASRNFRGGGRTLELSAQVWNGFADQLQNSVCTQSGTGRYGELNYGVAAEFLQPGLLSPRNAFSTRLFVERESFPDVFIRQSFGANLLFSRSIGRLSATALSYRPQYGSFDAAEVYFCSNFLICSTAEIEAVSATSLLAPVGLQVSTDMTTPFGAPVRGWTGLVAFEHASRYTISDYRYNRLILEGSVFKELGAGTQRVLAGRLRLGALFPRSFGGVSTDPTDLVISSPSKRFYAGGATTVRGFVAGRLGPRSLQTDVRRLVPAPDATEPAVCVAEEILDLTCDANRLDPRHFTEAPTGGNLLLVGNVEFRARLSENLQGTLFVDFGQVWSERTDFALHDVEFTPGFGVRYPTPIGPLRLDLGYNFRTRQPLPTLTAQLAPFDPASPREIVTEGADGTRYVISDELAPLLPPVLFGDDDLWSLSRFQLHLSVGQAF